MVQVLKSAILTQKALVDAVNPKITNLRFYEERIAKKKKELAERGVIPRMRVAFYATPDEDAIIILLALFALDAIACPLNPRLPSSTLEIYTQKLFPVFHLSLEKSATCSIAQETINSSLLLFTSGSSKEPKLACFSLNSLWQSAKVVSEHLHLTEDDTWYLALPLYHVSGIGALLRCIASGCNISFNPRASTCFSLVPTQLYRMLQETENPFIQARSIIIGGGPIPSYLKKNAMEKSLPLYATWGMTETSSMITLGIADSTEHSGFCLPHGNIKISKEQEICVQGPCLFQGYLDQSRIQNPLDSLGFFATNDVGFIDSLGRLNWTGRKDRMFVSYGENIHPEEIEQALLTLPEIIQAFVISIPDQEAGAISIAFIEHKGEIVQKAIQNLMRELLPYIKIPRYIFPLPQLSMIKPSYAILKQEALRLLKQL